MTTEEKLKEFNQTLKKTRMPVAQGSFELPQKPPYISWVVEDRSEIFADAKNYVELLNIQVELYTTKKDPSSEALLENVLRKSEIKYTVSDEGFLSDSKLYAVFYEMEV